MKKQHFSIKIKALKEKVWQTFWEDKTLRDWGNIIDEGLYMEGVMAVRETVPDTDSVYKNHHQQNLVEL